MLVPLETLSGWPPVPNPPILASLAIFVGFPVLVFLIVIAISKIATSIHEARGDDIQASDPLWVGGSQESGVLEAPSANPGADDGDQASATDAEQASASVPEQASASEGVEGDDTGEHVGGAGARW